MDEAMKLIIFGFAIGAFGALGMAGLALAARDGYDLMRKMRDRCSVCKGPCKVRRGELS